VSQGSQAAAKGKKELSGGRQRRDTMKPQDTNKKGAVDSRRKRGELKDPTNSGRRKRLDTR